MPQAFVIRDPQGNEVGTLHVPDGATPEQIHAKAAEAKAKLLTPPQPQMPAAPPETPGMVRALGQAAMDRVVTPAAEAVGDLSGVSRLYRGLVQGDIQGEARRRAEELRFRNTPRTLLGELGDVASIAGPVMAPGATVAGIGADAGARALGATPETAGVVGTAAELLTPVAGMVRAGTKRGIERAASEAVKDVPADYQKITKEVGSIYDRVRTIADLRGAALTPQAPGYQAIAKDIGTVRELLGPSLAGRQKEIIDGVEATIAAGQPLTYAMLDDASRFLRNTLPSPGSVTLMEKNVARTVKHFERVVDQGMRETVAGTPLERALNTAAQRWRDEVVPYRRLATELAKPKATPRTMMLAGTKMADARELKAVVRQGLEEAAEESPGALVSAWRNMPKKIKALVDDKRGADQVIDSLAKLDRAYPRRAIPTGMEAAGPMSVILAGGAGGAYFKAFTGDAWIDVPLAAALGLTASRVAPLIARGLRTPAGTRQAANLGVLIAKELEQAQGD